MSQHELYCPNCGDHFPSGDTCPKCKVNLQKKEELTSTHKQKFKLAELPDHIPIPDTQRPTLIIYQQKDFVKNMDLEKAPELIIGRSPKADIWLARETVSKKHARIFKKEDYYFVEDMGSRNGTFVNSEVLSPNASRILKDGDIIRVSTFYLCCHIPEKSASFYAKQTFTTPEKKKSSHDSSAQTRGFLRENLRETSPEIPVAPSSSDSPNKVFERIENLSSEEECNTLFAIKADQKIQEKFNEAEGIVRHYLKRVPEEMGNASLACLYKPLTQIGGDFYSVVPLGNNKLGLAIGDVSGHGMPAALIMIACITMLELYGRQCPSPAEILSNVNSEIASRLENGKFVTVFYGILDTESGGLVYSSAGHHPPLLFNPERGISLLEGKGSGFGIVRREVQYQEYTINLSPGDRLLIFTDGVLEAGSLSQKTEETVFIDQLKETLNTYNRVNFEEILDNLKGQIETWESQEEFGLNRLMDVIRNYPDLTIQEILNKVFQVLEQFIYPQQVDDDITMIGVDWKK